MNILSDIDVDSSKYQSVFFERPVSGLRKRNIAILAGRNSSLFEVQQAYMIINAMNHNPVLIADDHLRDVGLPADIYLSTKNKMHYDNSEEALSIISDCHALIAGVGLELNSSMQLLLERVLGSYQRLVVLTESTFKFPGLEKMLGRNVILAGSTKKLLSFGQKYRLHAGTTGLLLKAELLSRQSAKLDVNVLCIEDHQILAVLSTDTVAVVINSIDRIDSSGFLSILISLLSDRSAPLENGWNKYVFAAGDLYKNHFQKQKNPQLLKDFLQSQF